MNVSQRVRFGVGLSVVALVAAGLSFVAEPPAAVSAAWVCDSDAETDTYDQSAVRGRLPQPDANGKTYPIVTIHGITGSDADFTGIVDLSTTSGDGPQPPRSLLDVMAGVEGVTAYQGLPNAHVYSFSYTPNSLRWVDDERVGERFAAVIDCLHERHGTPVSVVAHSMGGLVTRWVANTVDAAGVPRADKLGQIITLGTPYLGSDIAAAAGGVSDTAEWTSRVWKLITMACGDLGTETGEGSCGQIPLLSAGSSEAGRALRAGSSELAALEPWPSGPSVHALAGSTTLGVRLFNASLGVADLGDIVVGTPSAIGEASSHRTFNCPYEAPGTPGWDALTEVLRVSDQSRRQRSLVNLLFSQPCYHGNLMRSVPVVNETLGQLSDWIDNEVASAVSDEPVAEEAISPASALARVEVPSLCQHPAGVAVDGTIPSNDPLGTGGYWGMNLDGAVAGQLDDDPPLEYAVTVDCSAGGVSWPSYVLLYDDDVSLVGHFNLGDLFPNDGVWRGSIGGLTFDPWLSGDVGFEESGTGPWWESYFVLESFDDYPCVTVGDLDTFDPYGVDVISGEICWQGGQDVVSSAPDPVEIFTDYLLAAGDRNYSAAWSMLTAGYQNKYGSYDRFTSFWNGIDVVGINSTSVVTNGSTATITADLWFRRTDGTTSSEIVEVDITGNQISDYRFIRAY
jgi:pimeloyl-ACP methyl ester carboxylesterase